jgi:hypothetical protein
MNIQAERHQQAQDKTRSRSCSIEEVRFSRVAATRFAAAA